MKVYGPARIGIIILILICIPEQPGFRVARSKERDFLFSPHSLNDLVVLANML